MQLLTLQALKATSLEKSVVLRKERDAWATCENERAAREAAEGELVKECEISAELRQKCAALATEALEAREKVAPLEKRVSNLTQESQEQKAAAEGYKGEVARLEALLAEKDLALNQVQNDLSAAQSEVVRWHRSSVENEKRAKGKNCIFYLAPFVLWSNFPDLFHFLFCFSTESEKMVAEATSAAEALQGSLDVEVTNRSALEAVVTSACEGLGVPASRSSLWSRVEALYSWSREKMREALHSGVKKALAVVSSHYVGIDLPAVCEGYVLPDDEMEALEELQRLEDVADAPGDALAAIFDAEVELPPSARKGLRRQGNKAL